MHHPLQLIFSTEKLHNNTNTRIIHYQKTLNSIYSINHRQWKQTKKEQKRPT